MAVKVAIINYGMGNIQSVSNALKFLGYHPSIADEAADLRDAEAYILPGVGAFGEAMHNLENLGLIPTLEDEVLGNKKALFGICLGMQLLAGSSEELGSHRGLGWIDAEILPIPEKPLLRVPHVGWNQLKIHRKEPLFSRLDRDEHFYFDHSFYMQCRDEAAILATCDYGTEMAVAIRKENIFATQFHPEKSQTAGLKLLRNFLNYAEASLC